MNDRFLFNAVVSSYYDIDTSEKYEEFEPQIYLENVDLFSDEIGIDYDRLLDAVQRQLKLEKPETSQVMQHFEDNSNSSGEEYVTIKPDKVLQCTGLKDKNGKLIFEGDIVEVQYIGSQIPLFKNEYSKEPEKERFEIFCHPEWLKFYAKNDNYRKTCEIHSLDLERIRVNDYNKVYEVIGNIYENKSLLESEG